MNYSAFKKSLEKIDEIIKGSGMSEEDIEIGVCNSENNAFDIKKINFSVDINTEIDTLENNNGYVVIAIND